MILPLHHLDAYDAGLVVHHLDAYDAGLVVEKKGVAVKESLITAVSNDADMITRRLIEATPQLDGEGGMQMESHFKGKPHSSHTSVSVWMRSVI